MLVARWHGHAKASRHHICYLAIRQTNNTTTAPTAAAKDASFRLIVTGGPQTKDDAEQHGICRRHR
jgi:hypothetical protein